MKLTKLFAASSLALLGSMSGEEPVIPTGFLDASALLVRSETNVDLTWEVNIPASEIEELIEIPTDEPTIIAKEDVAFEVRMLSAEYAYLGEYVLAQGQYRYADSPSYTFFWGYGDDADDLARKSCDILKAGEELQFTFRGSKNGFKFMPSQHRTWFSRRWSGTGPSWYNNDTPAIMLKNGDRLPARVTPPGQVDASSVLAPYLAADRKTINIGPKDLIILAELNRDLGEEGADYQDFVILVSFTEAANSECIRKWEGPQPPVVTPPTTPTTPTEPTEPPVIPEMPEVPGNPE